MRVGLDNLSLIFLKLWVDLEQNSSKISNIKVGLGLSLESPGSPLSIRPMLFYFICDFSSFLIVCLRIVKLDLILDRNDRCYWVNFLLEQTHETTPKRVISHFETISYMDTNKKHTYLGKRV